MTIENIAICLTPRPFGLGRSPPDLAAIVKEQRDPALLAEKVKPLAESRRPTKEEEENKPVHSRVMYGSTNAEYLTARITRDCPAVLEEMKAGKYPSVREASKKEADYSKWNNSSRAIAKTQD